ncbi:MAG: DNA methyltransferase [Chloroflexi bacterium]|nr:DNA methyltransferase [Chloroflexota bacterium]
MSTVDVEHLRQIKTLPSLVKFLRDELDWPVEADEIDDIYFDYTPEELGLDEKHAAKIKEIKQLRSLDSKQPWGIFWVSFEKKRLPMVVLRRILGNLIIKRRAAARKADRPSWHLHDLLFISSYGEEEHRTLSFAHFTEDPVADELPVLRVLGWDDQNSVMYLDRVANKLNTHLRWPDDPDDVDAWRQRWSDAFTDRYLEAIRSADELIPRLAHLAANIRRRVCDVLDAETERGPMRRLFTAVQGLLIHDMNEDGFADMYAQTVAYGLLSARFSRPAGLTAQNLVQLTAVSNPFLENLLENLFRLNRGKFHFDIDEVGINDVLDLLRNTNMEAIKAAFSDKNPAEDPVIRFYEGFLKQYDPQQRVKRGVFFTPRPVVSYIVRSVHELLQTEFGLQDGLASIDTWADMKKRFPDLKIPQGTKPDDPFVCILDPATGTGTFLFECIEVIERAMKEKWCRELGKKSWNDAEIIRRWREYVPGHLLPRLYGYELMMAPYSIAHLKLSLKLGETGYQFREGDRLRIYLTNSLEPPTQLADSRLADMFSTLATEAQEVNEIKANKRFTVVIANPPYSIRSSNMTEQARKLIEPFKFIDGSRIVEKGALQLEKNLNDDYVKFFGLIQRLLSPEMPSIASLISNHAFLDNPTFRGFRWNLLGHFSRIQILDLHGNSKKKEQVPPGKENENVFDIQQGVAINILLKHPSKSQSTVVSVADCWGTREEKYHALEAQAFDYRLVECSPPWFKFIIQDVALSTEFASYTSLTDIMPITSTGIKTHRDAFVIDFDEEPLRRRVNHFRSDVSDQTISEQYRLADTYGWRLSEARRRIRSREDWLEAFQMCLYRPFDCRYIYYHSDLVELPRFECMRHLSEGKNLALLATRQVTAIPYNHVMVTRLVSEMKTCSHDRGTNCLPLYLTDDSAGLQLGSRRTLNLSASFLGSLANALGIVTTQHNQIPDGLTPEDIFYYIYAVLHCPGYRIRYAQLLKTEFPRIPLTSSLALSRALSRLGGELVALHLMESPKLNTFITKWRGAIPSAEIEKVTYADNAVWINKAQTEGFPGVPEDVWNFHIGGYHVCHKWLDDRRKAKRRLSADDITHYQKIVVALNETIRLMAEIDKVIEQHGGWPGAFV